jgi:hypothetical protein
MDKVLREILWGGDNYDDDDDDDDDDVLRYKIRSLYTN